MPDLKCLGHNPVSPRHKTHAGLVICLRYSIGRYQKHQQSLIYQMLLLTHSPKLHLDHPTGKLISSRRNELFCSLTMEFYHLKTPFKYTQLQPNKTTLNRSDPIPFHLPLLSPESTILSLPRHSLFMGQPAWNNWSGRSSHLLPTQDNWKAKQRGTIEWAATNTFSNEAWITALTFLGCSPSVIEYFHILFYIFIITFLSWFLNLLF